MIRALILVVLLATAAASAAIAQPRSAERRVALVIGNGAYQSPGIPALPNPPGDARATAEVLGGLGFTVIEAGIDLDAEEMDAALKAFAAALEGADVGLFFYAGHGLQVNGENYLLPVDSAFRDENDLDAATSVRMVQALLEQDGSRTNIIIIDACRDNPLAKEVAARGLGRSRSLARDRGGAGFAPMTGGPSGTLIGFATSPDRTASDGVGEHSPYTEALLETIVTPALEVEDVFKGVARRVREATDGQQVPWFHTSLTQEFYFAAPEASTLEVSEAALWELASSRNERETYIAYLRRYPGGAHAEEARAALAEAGPDDREPVARPLEIVASELLAGLPASGVGELITGGFSFGDTRVPTACGRELAMRVGAALGGSVSLARRAVPGLGDARRSRGGARRSGDEGGPGDLLGRPTDPTTWLLEGSYARAAGELRLTFALLGREGDYRSTAATIVPTLDSSCDDEVPPRSSPLTVDYRRGELGLALASERGRTPVYAVTDPPARVDLKLQLDRPAHLYCFERDDKGHIQKLLPNIWRPDALVDATEVLDIPGDLSSQQRTIWKASTPQTSIIKCFATDEPVALPDAIGDIASRPGAIEGLDDAELLRAFRESDAPSLAEASVVLVVLAE